jgi:hypothetical protein
VCKDLDQETKTQIAIVTVKRLRHEILQKVKQISYSVLALLLLDKRAGLCNSPFL